MNSKFITLNRSSEWQRCLLWGLEISGHSLVPSKEGGNGIVITGSVDSTEHNFRWRGLLVDAQLPENAVMRVSAYAANSTIIEADGHMAELDSLLRDTSVSAQKRLEMIDKLFVPLYTNCFDGPLNLCGRYIWLKLEFVMLEKRELSLNKIKLLLHRESIMEYLPEVYRVEDGENGFMSRFMSIFDSIFFGMDDSIEELGDRLDYRAAKGDFLRYLAGWIKLEDTAYLSDGEIRSRIKRAAEDYRRIGVKQGLVSWIEHEYGVTPNIIEYYNVRRMVYEGKERDTYHRLFGENPFKFFVLLPEKTFTDTHDANIFMEKLKSRIPSYTEAEVIIIRKNIVLGSHTYLGVNSVISGYAAANTDSGTGISHEIILGGSKNEQQ